MGLTFVISTGLRVSVLCLNSATLSARSLRMKEVSGCEDSVTLEGRKGYALRVPAGAFRKVDIVSCRSDLWEAEESKRALHR